MAKGSSETPAHNHHDFKFKDYAPLVFREIRERFGILSQDYMLSLTSEYVLVEMFTNSRSGSFSFSTTCHVRQVSMLRALGDVRRRSRGWHSVTQRTRDRGLPALAA